MRARTGGKGRHLQPRLAKKVAEGKTYIRVGPESKSGDVPGMIHPGTCYAWCSVPVYENCLGAAGVVCIYGPSGGNSPIAFKVVTSEKNTFFLAPPVYNPRVGL